MKFNYTKLSLKIIEHFGTQENFAEAMGLSEETISKKLNNKVGWSDRQIVTAIDLLEIDPEDLKEYFFNQEVQTV